MKIATWNVNSIRVREAQVLDWLDAHEPDVLALQEIKVTDEAFPAAAFEAAGYHAVVNGQKTYNGVALLSREAPVDPVADMPAFEDPQKRVVAASFRGVRVVNVYVPNGQSVGSDKYEYKLRWLAALRDYLDDARREHERVVVLGDFNIAPADEDVHDPEEWRGKVLCSDAERAALGEILELGYEDVFRRFIQPDAEFSWWDYRAAGFRRNRGLRIDLVLATAPLAADCKGSSIDKEPRAQERPSDHAPVIAEF